MTKLVGGGVRRIEKARGRDALLLVSLALVCLVFSGCAGPKPGTTISGEEPRLPSAEADIRGVVTEVGRMLQENSGGGGAGRCRARGGEPRRRNGVPEGQRDGHESHQAFRAAGKRPNSDKIR